MLYIVATPIGNLEDITYRAVRVLNEVNLVAAEDTRRTAGLLNHLGIKKPLLSLNEHNEEKRATVILERLAKGESIAYVSDAGTPGISDPGARLVKRCREAGFKVVPVPGACAFVTALSVSGLEDGFVFAGFLPVKGAARKNRLKEISTETKTVILYEAPHRLQKTLKDLLEACGDRQIIIARELTKIYEEIVSIKLSEALEKYSEPIGEFVLLIERAEEEAPDEKAAEKYMKELLEKGTKRKEAAALTAEKYGISKNDAYKMQL